MAQAPPGALVDVVLASGGVRGRVPIGLMRVSDVLNRPDQDVLTVEDAAILPLRGGEPLARNSRVLLKKPDVLFVIDRSQPELTATIGKRQLREHMTVVLFVGAFMLRGTVHVPPRTHLTS